MGRLFYRIKKNYIFKLYDNLADLIVGLDFVFSTIDFLKTFVIEDSERYKELIEVEDNLSGLYAMCDRKFRWIQDIMSHRNLKFNDLKIIADSIQFYRQEFDKILSKIDKIQKDIIMETL